MKLLSLDMSSKSTGWAIFENDKLINYGCIASGSTDLIKRIHIMVDTIENIIQEYQPEHIILEEVRPDLVGSNIQTYKALTWLQGAFAMMVHDKFPKVETQYIQASSWRSKCGIKTGRGIKRDALKQADINFVKEKYSITVNDDIADAIGIGYSKIAENKDDDFFF